MHHVMVSVYIKCGMVFVSFYATCDTGWLISRPPTLGFFLNLGSDNDADEEQHEWKIGLFIFLTCFICIHDGVEHFWIFVPAGKKMP